MKQLFLFLLVLPVLAFGVNPVNKVPTDAAEFALNKQFSPANAFKYWLGSVVRQGHNTAYGVWDYSQVGGALTTTTHGGLETGITLPAKAIVRKVFFDVVTAPVSATNGTIAFTIVASGDLKSPAAAATWTTTNRIAGTPDDAVANMIKLSSQKKVYATIGSAAMTAGKIKIFVDYVVSE